MNKLIIHTKYHVTVELLLMQFEMIERHHHIEVIDGGIAIDHPDEVMSQDLVFWLVMVQGCGLAEDYLFARSLESRDKSEVWKRKIKIDIDDTDIGYAVQRLRDLQWQHDEFMRESIGPAEAVNAFMEWRNSRDERAPCLSEAELIERFCQAQGWHIKNEKYNELIRHVVEDGNVQVAIEEG